MEKVQNLQFNPSGSDGLSKDKDFSFFYFEKCLPDFREIRYTMRGF